MRPLSYGMLYFFWGCAQTVAMSALLWTLFPGLSWLPWSMLCAVAVLVGLTFSHRRAGPAGWGGKAIMGAFIAAGLLALLTRGTSAFPFIGIMLLLGRNFTLSARRDLYFNLAICVVLFTEPLSGTPSKTLWIFGLVFLVVLVAVLIADYADQRIAQSLSADAARVPRELMTAGNLAFVSFAIVGFGLLIFFLLPQPRPFDIMAWRDLRSTYTHISPETGRGRPATPAPSGGSANQGGSAGAGQSGPGDTGGGAAGTADGSDKLFEVVSDRKLYLRTGTLDHYEAGRWIRQDGNSTTLKGVVRFVLPGGEKREMVPYGIEIFSEMPETIPTAIRPQFLRTDTQELQVGKDSTVSLPVRLMPGRVIYAESAVSYRGRRPASDAMPLGNFEALRALPPGKEDSLVEQSRRFGLGRTSALRRAEAMEEHFRTSFRVDTGAESEDPFELLSQESGPPRAFSSAFTLLLRADGIPSRVVEGYRVRRFDPFSQRYTVESRDRHAWVEAYLDSRWVVFEPLPGAPLPGPDSAQSLFETLKDRVEIWLEDIRGERAKLKQDDWVGSVLLAIAETLAVALLALLRYGPWLLLAAAASYFLMRRLGKSFSRLADQVDRFHLWRHRHDDPARKVVRAHEMTERACRRRGVPRRRTENHVEYSFSAAGCFPHLEAPLSLLGNLFGEARYGNRPVSREDARRALSAYLDVLRYIDMKIPGQSA
jgi:hypothetical protein